MYKLIPWNSNMDLTEFYKLAEKKGFLNNSSQKNMIDCFDKEREKQIWILYYNNTPVGSVGCHTLDVLGPNSYRICARNCVLTEIVGRNGMYTRRVGLQQYQNFTDQFYIPACIEWAGRDKDLYISSNDSKIASQRLVHNIYCPTHAERGILTNVGRLEYRGTIQTFWKLDVEKFYIELGKYPRWHLCL